MPTAEALLVGPVLELDHIGILRDEIIERNVAAAPVAVAIVCGRVIVIVGQILADHECMAGSVDDRANLHRPLKRLAEEYAPATQIVMAVMHSWVVRRRRLLVNATYIRNPGSVVRKSFSTSGGIHILWEALAEIGVVKHTFVIRNEYGCVQPLRLIVTNALVRGIRRALQNVELRCHESTARDAVLG